MILGLLTLAATSWAVPAEEAEPAISWMEVLIRASGRDGERMDAQAGQDALTALCESSGPLACEAPWLAPFDLAAAADALAPACGDGDGPACVLVGWQLQTVGRLEESLRSYERACEAGEVRGCTEAAWARLEGRGTVSDPQGAYSELLPLCRDGDGRACIAMSVLEAPPDRAALYQYAGIMGTPEGYLRLARTLDEHSPDVVKWLDRACTDGHSDGCIALGRALPSNDRDRIRSSLSRACALDPMEGCAVEALWRAQVGEGSVAEARDGARSLCKAGNEGGCWSERLLATGTPPLAWWEDELSEANRRILELDFTPRLFPCYVDRLWRGDVRGGFEVMVQVAQDGRIQGAAAEGVFVDPEMSRCISDVARDLKEVHDPPPKAARQHFTVRLDHAAKVKFRQKELIDIQEVVAIRESMADRERDVDACLLTRGEPDPLSMTLSVQIGRKGQVAKVEAMEGTELELLDACVLSVLSRPHPTIRLLGQIEGTVWVDFLQPADSDDAPVTVRPRPPWTEEPLTLRVLGLAAESFETNGERGRLRRRDLKSVVEIHEDFASFIASQTGGQVKVDSEVRLVGGQLGGLVIDEDVLTPEFVESEGEEPEETFDPDPDPTEASAEDRQHRRKRLIVEPEDLTQELLQEVDPGAWDVVVVWAPLPWGAGYPELYTAWTEDHLRGAVFGAVPTFPGRARFDTLLQVVMPLLALRAGPNYSLPEPLLPVRLTDGRYFDTRPWSERRDSEMWYSWLISEELPPKFWDDVAASAPTTLPLDPRNVALSARPLASRDISGVLQLNDRVLDYGRITSAARQSSIVVQPPDGSWFGLELDRMRVINTVVAHLNGVESVYLEVSEDGEEWTRLQAVDPVVDGIATFRFPARPVYALRVRVDVALPGEPFGCREIEAYAVE